MTIKEGCSGLFYKTKVLTLKDDSASFGEVHFRPRRLFRPAELCFISTEPHTGEGYGKELLQAFIKETGHGRIITSEIVHNETWETLRRLDILHTAYTQGMYTVTDHHLLSEEIPITRFLERGGIHILRLDIEYGKNKLLPTYEDIVAQHDSGNDHFINYFRTQLVGNVK